MKVVARDTSGREGGFSLVELTVAIGMILISVLAAISSELSSMNVMRSSRESNVAMADLQSAMEQILLLPLEEIPDESGLYAPGVPIAAFQDLHLNRQAITATYPNYVSGEEVPDPLEIVLTITWKDRLDRARSSRLVTMKTR